MGINIIVDGYNLIRQSPSLSSIDIRDLQGGREELIKRLSLYRKSKRHPITVVFDGWMAENPTEVRQREKGITIIFSRSGEKADEVIKRIAIKGQERIVVVSSDHDLASFCQKQGAAILGSREFEMKMQAALHPRVRDDEQAIQYSRRTGTKKKGPSRRLSKRARRDRVKVNKL